jgi:hypothetical protein
MFVIVGLKGEEALVLAVDHGQLAGDVAATAGLSVLCCGPWGCRVRGRSPPGYWYSGRIETVPSPELVT